MSGLINISGAIAKALGGETSATFKSGDRIVAVADNGNGTITITDVNSQLWYRYRGDRCEQQGEVGPNRGSGLTAGLTTGAGPLLGIIRADNKVRVT